MTVVADDAARARAAAAAGTVYIERENRKAAFDAYTDAAAKINAGASVVVFAEGTRDKSYALRAFKKGPFVLAIAAQAPIVPTLIYGTLDVKPHGQFAMHPGTVHVHFLAPIPTAGLTYEDRDRLAMLLAVLHRHAGVACMDQDVFVNAVGGVRISEPAADLAVMLSIQSSLRGKPLPKGFIAFGEIGLAGEVRPAPRGQERLKEAAKLGFDVALIPKANAPKKAIEGMRLLPVERVDEAIAALRELD